MFLTVISFPILRIENSMHNFKIPQNTMPHLTFRIIKAFNFKNRIRLQYLKSKKKTNSDVLLVANGIKND